MADRKQSIPGYEYVKSSGGIHEYRLLANDLRVLVKEERSVPVATCMVTYHVGSRDEAVGHTGSTHMLEHLLFKHSKNYGANYWTVLMDKGAQSNATTWLDRTNYYHTIPVEHLADAVGYEADRMRNAFFSKEELETERTIVLNELEFRVENEPMEQLDQDMWATAYQAHPYHHPTIGWRSDIEGAPHDALMRFYDKFYWPNNATVTIIGDFALSDALALVRKSFEHVPRSPHDIPHVHTKEAKQYGVRRVEVKKAGQTNIVGVAHKTPPGIHKDSVIFSVLARILTGGKSSRLYRALVEAGLATDVVVRDTPFKDEGLFSLFAMLLPGVSHEKVERVIRAEYEAIQKKGVLPAEVKRAIAQVETESSFSRDGSAAIAGYVNEAIALGDWTTYTRFKDDVAKVTAQDVKRVVQTYFTDAQSTVGWFVGLGNGVSKKKLPSSRTGRMCMLHTHAQASSRMHDMKVITDIKEIAEDGMQIVVVPTGVEDAVTIEGSFLAGTWFASSKNPVVPELLVHMLDKGTKKMNKRIIAERLENMGASVDFSIDEYRVRFHAKCIKEYIEPLLRIIAEEVAMPLLSPLEFAKEKKRYLAELLQETEATATMANATFYQTLYPAMHPNHGHTPQELIRLANKVTVQDLKKFHTFAYGKGSLTVVFAGDVNEATSVKYAKQAFGKWKNVNIKLPQPKAITGVNHRVEKNMFIPEKGNVDVTFGNAIGITRTHKDYYPLVLGIAALGGSFSARLMKHVRESKGLTYGIYARVGGAQNGKDGYWAIRGMFAPALLAKGKEATLEEITAIGKEGITKEELAVRKEVVKGSFVVGASSSGSLAHTILGLIEEGLSKAYLAEYLAIIDSISLEEVNAALKKYVSGEQLLIVQAGTLPKE
jgi:zinc protease